MVLADPGITAITYDWRNRATKMVDGANTYLYRYDAAGLRNFRKVVPTNGPTRVEFFIGGMVLDPNGAILRLDISDGFVEITQNGTMNRNMILKDWIGTLRVTLDGAGIVAIIAMTKSHLL